MQNHNSRISIFYRRQIHQIYNIVAPGLIPTETVVFQEYEILKINHEFLQFF